MLPFLRMFLLKETGSIHAMKIFALIVMLMVAAPASANSMEEAFCQAAAVPVHQMKPSEKLCRSLARALYALPEATAKEASFLLTPENMAMMSAMMAAWLGSQGIPVVGQAVDAALLSVGVIMIAVQSVELTQELWKYANLTRDARTHEQLSAAAGHLARAIAIAGINVVAFILTKKAMRGVGSEPLKPPPGAVIAQGRGGSIPVLEGIPSAAPTHLSTASRTPRVPIKPMKSVNLEAFARWAKRAERRPTPDSSEAFRYQKKHAGPEELLVKGGGKEVWSDGVRMEQARLVEVKFIQAPEKSPYIEGSKCNERVRALIQEETTNEFRRYAAVLADEATPATALEVIVNDARAVPFFERLLRTLGMPGAVVVKP